MRPAQTTFLATALLVTAPFLISDALAHGGAYRGPAGEVPDGSREPSDPPPPPEGGGPVTPGGETGTPGTGGGDVGGPGTPSGDTPTPGSGGSGSGPSVGGDGPSGPITGKGAGRAPGSAKGPGYAGWSFWWNYNKDDVLADRRSVRNRTSTGQGPHTFSRRRAEHGVISPTTAAVNNRIVPALRDLLAQDDLHFDIRSAAAIALAKAGDASIVPDLERMARNEGSRYHRVVEESAALAFGLLGEGTDDVRATLVELMQDDQRNASYVRPFAAVSLGLLGADQDGTAQAALFAVLYADEAKSEVKPAALVALGLLDDERAVAPLLHVLQKRRVDRKGAAELSDAEMPFVVAALGRIGAAGVNGDDTAVFDAVSRLLTIGKRKGAAVNMRRSAAIALGQLSVDADARLQRKAFRALRDAAKDDKDASVRNFAMVAVGRLTSSDTVDAELRSDAVSMLGHYLERGRPSASAQPFAGLSMALIGRAVVKQGRAPEEDIRKPLREKFADAARGDPKVRGAYAIASGLVRDPFAVESLSEALLDRGLQAGLRGQTAIALGLIGDHSTQEAVRTVLRDETDRELRVRAAVGAGLMGDARAVGELVKILEEERGSQYVLGSVALALGQIGDERAIDPLLAIVTDEENVHPEITRALATVALGQIADRDPTPELARVSRDVNYRAIGVSKALVELLTIL